VDSRKDMRYYSVREDGYKGKPSLVFRVSRDHGPEYYAGGGVWRFAASLAQYYLGDEPSDEVTAAEAAEIAAALDVRWGPRRPWPGRRSRPGLR